MASIINKKTLKHLAELSRIELTAREEEKITKDLQDILDHFEELKKLDTENVRPMAGGTHLRNIFREDEERENKYSGAGVEGFPEKEAGFLKVPSVFLDKE